MHKLQTGLSTPWHFRNGPHTCQMVLRHMGARPGRAKKSPNQYGRFARQWLVPTASWHAGQCTVCRWRGILDQTVRTVRSFGKNSPITSTIHSGCEPFNTRKASFAMTMTFSSIAAVIAGKSA